MEVLEQEIDVSLLFELTSSSTDAIQVSDEEGRLVYINKTAEQRLGIKQSEVSDYNVSDFEKIFVKRNSEEWKAHIQELKEKETIIINGYNRNQKTNKIFPVEVNVTYKVINYKGYVIATSRDATEKTKLHLEIVNEEKAISAIYACFQKIALSQEYWPTITSGLESVSDFLNLSKVNIYMFSEKLKGYKNVYTYCSSRIDKNKDKNKDIVTEREFSLVKNSIDDNKPVLIDTGCPFIPELEKTDEQCKIICYFLPIIDNKKMVGFFKVDEYRNEDFSFENRIKKYETYNRIINTSYSLLCRKKELSINNRNFRHLYKSINDTFFLFNLKKDKYLFISPTCSDILAQTQDEFYEAKDCVPKRIFEDDKEKFTSCLEGLHYSNFVTTDFRIIQTDGNLKFIRLKAYAIRDKNRELVEKSGIFIDITTQKVQEMLLKESNDLVHSKNRLLEDKNSQISQLVEKLERDLYFKSVKLSNTINFLNRAKADLDKLSNKGGGADSNDLIRIKRYFNQIASDEEQLWEEIQLEYEKIRPQFFDKIKEINKLITKNELKHCYYIVSGLSGKEVADILNISIRSVETARYRIKKKLNLSKGDTLMDFLNKL